MQMVLVLDIGHVIVGPDDHEVCIGLGPEAVGGSTKFTHWFTLPRGSLRRNCRR